MINFYAPRMFKSYGNIAVNSAKYKDALQLIEWITSDAGQKNIAAFKVDDQHFPIDK